MSVMFALIAGKPTFSTTVSSLLSVINKSSVERGCVLITLNSSGPKTTLYVQLVSAGNKRNPPELAREDRARRP